MKQKISFQPWLFLTAAVVYDEMLLLWWTAEAVQLHRAVTVAVCALVFGSLAGLLSSFLSRPRWIKLAAVTIASALAVVYFGFYVVFDTYREFLTPGTIFSGAGGVAADFLPIALAAVLGNLWRLGILLVVPVFYGLFCQAEAAQPMARMRLAAYCAALCLLGLATVKGFRRNQEVLGAAYRFDSAAELL